MLACIILCGGQGTRIRSVSEDQKCLLEFSGKPFLSIILSELDSIKFDKIFLAVGYKAENVKALNFQNFSNKIEIVEEKTPLGTGGAIKNIVQRTLYKNYLVLNGDTYQLGKIPNIFLKVKTPHKVNIGVALMKNPSRYSVISDTSSIIRFKKPLVTGHAAWVLNGVFNLSRNIFSKVNENHFSLEDFLTTKHFNRDEVNIVKFQKGFIDFGIPKDFRLLKSILG